MPRSKGLLLLWSRQPSPLQERHHPFPRSTALASGTSFSTFARVTEIKWFILTKPCLVVFLPPTLQSVQTALRTLASLLACFLHGPTLFSTAWATFCWTWLWSCLPTPLPVLDSASHIPWLEASGPLKITSPFPWGREQLQGIRVGTGTRKPPPTAPPPQSCSRWQGPLIRRLP